MNSRKLGLVMARDAAFRKAEEVIEAARRTTVRELSLRGMELTEMPESLYRLSQLQTLDLDRNRLTALPESLGRLSQLQTLSLDNNRLTALPESLGQLSQLQTLDLDNNQLTALPESLGELSQLQTLLLDNNQLTALSESLGQLSQLQELYLQRNQLTALPESLGLLSQLQKLYLFGNRLTALPESLGQLWQLQLLDLEANQLTALPESLGQLSQLRRLDLGDNPGLRLLPEIIDQYHNPSAILNFYFSRLRETEKPLNEAKILLVGDGDVGKTSLIRRLIDNEFDAEESKTRGVRIRQWPLHEGDREIRANIWDFGGQDIYHSTHQFFLTERSLYVLLVSSRGSEAHTRIDYWLKTIQNAANDAPVIIVANKCDQHAVEIDWSNLQYDYPAIRGVVKRASCKTEEGMPETEQLIRQEVSRLEHVETALPASWFAVKTRLEDDNANYQTFPQYRELCIAEGIDDEASQEQLLRLLNDLGIALHYRGSSTLEETNVLKPDWVTGGFYRIIDTDLEKESGVLDRARLDELLPDDEYPPDKKEFILGMMQQFELCFPFDDGNKFLIPGLLPFEEPPTGDWDDVLLLEYRYDLLPSAVVSRLTMRMHTHLLRDGQQRVCWRTGAVFVSDDGHNEVHVRADGNSDRLIIRVRGREAGRRHLLAAIRSQLREIHGETIKATELVPVPGHPQVLVGYKHLRTLERLGKQSFVPTDLDVEVSVQEMLDGYRMSTAEDPGAVGDGPNVVNNYFGSVHKGDKNVGDKISLKNSQLTNSQIGTNQTITDSFNVIQQSSQEDEVKLALCDVVAAVEKLMDQLAQQPDARASKKVGRDLRTFVDEAADVEPRPGMLIPTAEGLIEAAQTVAGLTVPITTSVKAVLSLLGVELP
ncbi:MAG: leucine-rich repeat protein [Planctomycetaceae bacterium]|nr:leucine-rich repeat protein [Planctomycetaceae bacterium]MBT6497188.1 leucine-rich repeat protein [Planctomycetaceae bacterium]